MRTLLALATLVLLATPLASAHATAYSADGKWKFVYGFLNEPAATYTKNGLDLRIADNATGALLPGLEKNLTASLMYTDQTFTFTDFKGQFGKDGSYTGSITPTKPGNYKLHLVGTINGTPVDVTIPAKEDVHDLKDSMFPAASAPADVEARLAALEEKVKTQAETPATATGATGKATPGLETSLVLAVLGLAAVLLVRRRR